MNQMKFYFVLLLIVCCFVGCKQQNLTESSDYPSQEMVEYSSQTLGITSVVPQDWIAFWPAGVFVRQMPQDDPTFLAFGAVPDSRPGRVLSQMMGISFFERPFVRAGNREAQNLEWAQYSFEVEEGFLLAYNPDYGPITVDVAVAESDGKVFFVAIGSSADERDELYATVFLPAVDHFRESAVTVSGRIEPVVLPERDYWPTDGWLESTPEEQGMDAARIEEMMAFIEENAVPLKTVLIVRNGYVVLNEDISGYGSTGNLASVTKSFTSSLIGIAMQQGLIDNINQTVVSFFPDRQITDTDPRKNQMTLEDALTMRSGLDWPSGPCSWLDDMICGDYTTQIMLEAEDSLQFLLDQPMTSDPGSTFQYISGASHLLSGVVSEITGMSANQFAEEYLFAPLGINYHRWNQDGEDLSIGWSELYLTPMDMAKFGFLYLNEGQWDGQQVVSPEWVRQSCTPHTATSSGIQQFYGYQWWVNPDLGFCNAAGAGGNYIIVVPEDDLVVVFTAKMDGVLGQGEWWEGTPEELFRVFILPAVRAP